MGGKLNPNISRVSSVPGRAPRWTSTLFIHDFIIHLTIPLGILPPYSVSGFSRPPQCYELRPSRTDPPLSAYRGIRAVRKVQTAAQAKELPAHVLQAFEDYLNCGRLDGGFPRVRHDTCHEVIIPRGNAVIAAGDRVVFFAAESCVAQLESGFLATAGEA